MLPFQTSNQEPMPVKKIRKTRKDKGIKRGPRKPKTTEVAQPVQPAANPPSAPSPSLKFEDNWPRKVLAEGRNYGFALAFCKVENDTASTVGPISPCLDYLNDQVYSENTGKPYSAYGYKATKANCIGDKAHLVMAILPYFKGGNYSVMDAEMAYAKDHHAKIAQFLNQFESKMNLKTLTSVVQVADNRYLFSIDPFWCKWTYLVSTWSKLCRIGLESRKSVAPTSYEEALDMLDPNKIKTTDACYAPKLIKAVKSFVDGAVPDDDWNICKSWHNAGIANFAKL